MTLLRTTAIFAAVVLLPAAASAQGTPEQRAACTGDAMSLCGEFIPNVDRITACMKSKISQLSPGCRAHFSPQASRRARPTPVADATGTKHQPTY